MNLLMVTSRTVYPMNTLGESIAKACRRPREGMVTYAIIKDCGSMFALSPAGEHVSYENGGKTNLSNLRVHSVQSA